MTETFDVLILGSGQAGNPLAGAFAAKGRRVALVESKQVGGTCVNEGCTPTKTMVASAKVADQARRGPEFGVHTGSVAVRMAEVRARKRDVVKVWRERSEKKLEDENRIELIRGVARFSGPKTVEVTLNDGGSRTLTAEHIFINTGLRSATPKLPGLEDVPYLTNESVMELDTMPGRLLILGGGYIAVEFAQMFRRFGAAVTIASRGAQLLPREDPDVAECLLSIFREDGIDVILNAEATGVARGLEGVALTVKTGDGEQVLNGSHLLLAVGRTPNTDELNLESAGLHTDAHGFVPVNERLETAVQGIYALGDVKGGPAFTHISYDDYRIAAANLLEGGHRTTKDRQVPYTVFTDPELGRIGITAEEAKKSGRSVRVAKMPAESIARAYETGEKRGMMKVVVDRDSEEVLGAAVLAAQGGEMAAMLQIAMMGGVRYPALRDGVWAHPTWAEALNTIFSKWEDEQDG